MAQRNWASGGKIWSMHVKPVLLDCNFVVDSTNGNGLGIRSLKGPAVQNVFMHTSASPGLGNGQQRAGSPNGPQILNPNPASGYIVVQLNDNYNRSLSGCNSIVSPVGSSQIITSALTVGLPYVITVLGDATAADWHAIGVPAGLTPAVGLSFVAASTGSGASASARVAPVADAGSGIFSIEVVGDPNLSIAPNGLANQGFGAQIILACRKDSASDAPTIAAPANGTVISLQFLLSDSSVLIQGE